MRDEGQIATSHGEVLEEHHLLRGIRREVVEDGRHQRERRHGQGHETGLEADQQGEACEDFI